MSEWMVIEVAWLQSGASARLMSCRVPPGSTVAEALRLCMPDDNIDPAHLSLFSRPCTLKTILMPKDRLEVTGPLRIDPKAARHHRVSKQRQAAKRQTQ